MVDLTLLELDRALGDLPAVHGEQSGDGPQEGGLPAPFEPRMATIELPGISRLTPRSTSITSL
jgi:hypothetical protein